MKAYKGFDKDLTCLDYQFEVGKEHVHEGEAEVMAACNSVRWVPVAERFPEVDEYGDVDVLVHMDDGFIATCTYDRNASYIASDCWLLWQDAGNVTHWQPLPAAPDAE